MSSLAATQADGYYVPADTLDAGGYKPKSQNNQYLQRSVVRFELPFDGFCVDCDAIVGKGTRFNAHKAHIDNYFTSKIYEFTTKCRSCGKCEFKIRTNPKEQTFDYVVGIRKKVEEFDSIEAGTHGIIDTDIGAGIHQFKNGDIAISSTDESRNTGTRGALHLLEKNAAGHRKNLTEHDQMTSLLRLNSKTSGEDADANAALRASFRNDRKAKKQRVSDAVDIGLGRGIELSGMTEKDAKLAAIAINRRKQRRDGSDHAHKSEKNAFQSKRSENIFAAQKKSHASKTERKKSSSKCNGRLEKKEKDTTMSDKPRLRRKIELKSSTSNHLLAQSPTKQTENTSKQPLLASGMNALSGLIDHYGSDSD